MTQESYTVSRIYVVTPVEGAPFLLAEFVIDCPKCGQQTIQLAGHHLQLVRDVLVQAIDEYPELTTGAYKQLGRTQIAGRANDPSTS